MKNSLPIALLLLVSSSVAGGTRVAALQRPGEGRVPALERRMPVSGSLQHASEIRAVAGDNVHLALWYDHRPDGRHLMFRALDEDGLPLAPAVDAGPVVQYGLVVGPRPLAAWDGTRFLVAWEQADGTKACFVARDGSSTPPFVIPRTFYAPVDSLAWDGEHYVAGFTGRFLRLSREGFLASVVQANGPQRVTTFDEPVILLPQADGFVGLVESILLPGVGSTPLKVTVGVIAFNRDVLVDRTRAEPLLGSLAGQKYEFRSWGAASPVSTLATGGGHRLLLWFDLDRRWNFAGKDGTAVPLPEYGGRAGVHERQPSPWAVWHGKGFMVAAADNLGCHAPGGKLLELRKLPADTLASALALNKDGSAVVLTVRPVNGTFRVQSMRVGSCGSW